MKVILSSSSSQAKQEPDKVVHNYRDHSKLTESALTLLLQNDESLKVKASDHSFPVRLHYLLEQMAKDGLSDIVSWQIHGRCFLVHNQERFVKEILPVWFRQSTYASFQRQLNLYGFKRLTTGRDKGAYYHELFLRGKRFLAARIERIKVKGTGARKPSSPGTEPNFYMTPFLPDEPSVREKPQGANAPVAAESAPVPSFASSSPLMTSPELSIQRLLLSSAMGASSHHVADPPSGWNTLSPHHLLAPSAGASLLLEAQRAQVASCILLGQVREEHQRQEAAAFDRLARLVELGGTPAFAPDRYSNSVDSLLMQQFLGAARSSSTEK